MTQNKELMYTPEGSFINMTSDMDVRLLSSMGGDDDVVQAARVSTGIFEAPKDPTKDEGLINYLMRSKHGSPFEHNSVKFFVSAPIFVFREFMTHRIGFSYNEVSGRYSVLEPLFYWPSLQRPLKNVGTSSKPEMQLTNDHTNASTRVNIARASVLAWDSYREMLEMDVAREIARVVLPLNIYSSMYVTTNLRAVMNFLTLRTHRKDATHVSRPQLEIEMVADKMEEFVTELFPVSMKAFNQHGRVAP